MSTLSPSLQVPYKAVNGNEIPVDVYLPLSSSTTALEHLACPVIIMVHGGAFMLGHARMNNLDQVQDCLDRGWIVLCVEHRLCPGVDILDGPMSDVRDAVRWAKDANGLNEALGGVDVKADVDRVVIMGTSSGGHLALSTAWRTDSKPLAILDFYGAKYFSHPFWSQPLENMPAHFYDPLPNSTISRIQSEKFILKGGVSLEGQSSSPSPDEDMEAQKLRTAFAMHTISTGKVLSTIYPPSSTSLELIDPYLNISSDWPPTCIVHGTDDKMIPTHLSRSFANKLRESGVKVEMNEVEGEGHTFCGKMEKGGKTWETQRKGFDFLERVLKKSYT